MRPRRANDLDDIEAVSRRTPDASRYAIIDAEISLDGKRIGDIGGLRFDDAVFHAASRRKLVEWLGGVDYVCGHNIVHHDARYLFDDKPHSWLAVDTLYMSPLLFPERPYHRLTKDDKLTVDELNNPVNDCKKAKTLLFDEIERWRALTDEKRLIFATLLAGQQEFVGFLSMVGAPEPAPDIVTLIRSTYNGMICENAEIETIIRQYPCETAYALALIATADHRSVTPPWVLYNYPHVEHVVKTLRNTPCATGCRYCASQLDIHINLKTLFGHNTFRTYEGEPLQERATQAAIDGRSLLAIFPTGGGKSLTFQLPALMQGQTVHGLTVVISPLQSLMKDQVDSLADKGITGAVTINGLLDPISRSVAIERVMSGDASLLYIAPEMLRSATVERILTVRHVVRFVIDEAHCFSSWGQDFRVDYLYIGKFIREFQEKKKCNEPIPISCFTATAKQKVIQDICDYFRRTLGIELELFASTASRTNLHYSVIHTDTDADKYMKLRALIEQTTCPTIVYVSRTKRTFKLAEKLTRDGFNALPFNGKMESDRKTANQEAFMSDRTRIIVATSAFGMGVDKKDVGLVVHYDISDSLENYVQEAGRAGRDPSLSARCYVLYNDADLDKHFILLNQTKLTINEIQQVWKAVKVMTRHRMKVSCSALEIARQAGWDDSVSDIETRVRVALSALEQTGYLTRGNNVPHVYATGITVKNMDEARQRITMSPLFDESEVENAARVIKSLISKSRTVKVTDSEAESRVDYLADILGIPKAEVISVVERMRQEGILADSKDISAQLAPGDSERKSRLLLERFAQLERFILDKITDETLSTSFKQLNDSAITAGISTAKEKDVRTLLYFLSVKGYTRKSFARENIVTLQRVNNLETSLMRFNKRMDICRYTIEWLYSLAKDHEAEGAANLSVRFSIVELLNRISQSRTSLFSTGDDLQLEDVEEALLYLSKIGALQLDGGFLVIYNAMTIHRLKDNKTRYKQDDYRTLNEFYKQKIQQIHIVGEYANLMVRDYDAALAFVHDYFQMDYKKFIAKYFKGERTAEIQRNLTPEKYRQLFGQLSKRQMEIISDKTSRSIVVAAGPGSGKTRVLVHKLASLLLLEDVKHEQLLMLTFSRAAATEFKDRLMELIGNAAHFVDIMTFHSYCFDLLGRIGNLEDTDNVVRRAAEMIKRGDVEPTKIGKTVLVIDEAQDMGADEYALVQALMAHNEDMRTIAVGDDDQNIFEFRGSDSGYMYRLSTVEGGRMVEMTENYRSARRPVDFANRFVRRISRRMKSTPIISMGSNDGGVDITQYESKYMYQPVVDELSSRRRPGTSCILTQTNEEAAILVALLQRHGIKGKLIQTMDGMRIINMAETRYFLKRLTAHTTTPLIPDDTWDEAVCAVTGKYAGSTSLQYLLCCIRRFRATNKAAYLSDFKEFVFESDTSDFCEVDDGEIAVSTIHKAKGREFDNVYMLISARRTTDDARLRSLYVGITRAKTYVHIHTSDSVFDGIDGAHRSEDTRQYPMPEEIVLQLSHKDVFLNFSKNSKREVLALKGGDALTYRDMTLLNVDNRPVARLSTRMQQTIAEWQGKGYFVAEARVRFVVAWKPKDTPKDEPPRAVILPDIVMVRND